MIVISKKNLTATKENGEVVKITKTHIKLLEIMYQNRDVVLQYDNLNTLLAGTEFCSPCIARTHIFNLNKRFGFDLISSKKHIGIGYKLSEEIEISDCFSEAVLFTTHMVETYTYTLIGMNKEVIEQKYKFWTQ